MDKNSYRNKFQLKANKASTKGSTNRLGVKPSPGGNIRSSYDSKMKGTQPNDYYRDQGQPEDWGNNFEEGQYDDQSAYTQPLEMQSLQINQPNFNDQLLFDGEGTGGENVQVAVRIRPMLNHEYSRGDAYCVKVIDSNNLQVMKGNGVKHYRFNRVIDETKNQADVFHECNIAKMLNSALEGYSATIFGYGQTGSGKTYTIAGNEDKMGSDTYISDESEGIIPRSVRYLWQQMAQRDEVFYVRASYLEIYNEQLNDLLNNNTGNLNCR